MLLYQNKIRGILLITAAFFACSVTGCKKQEHPSEHPEQTQSTTELTIDELADAIQRYVIEKADEQGGFFLVLDDTTGEELRLSLDKVHRERLSRTGENEYFACADFMTPEGKTYDLDVFMTGSDKDSLVFSDFTIHKEDGRERYTWYKEEGIWKKNPVETASIETEAEVRQVGEDTSELQESLQEVKEDISEEQYEEDMAEMQESAEEELIVEEEHPNEEHPAEEHPIEDDDDNDDDDDDEDEHPKSEHPKSEHPTEHPI